MKNLLLQLQYLDVQKVYNTLRNFITGFDLETQLRSPRIKAYLARHKHSQLSSDRGRRINTVPYQNGFSLAIVPSIQSAVIYGHYEPLQRRVKMTKDDLLMWQLRAKISMTLAFIIDASASTRHFIKVIAHMLALLYRDAYRKKDKIGLVIFKENKAQVLIHPTRNYQLVLGSLARIAPSGWTPLASGLEKAYTILKEELRREREMIPCAVLVSDCYPEPLTHKFKDIFEEPAYQDVLRVANMYKREKIPIVVINPYHNLEDTKFNLGTKLGLAVARISSGKYFGVPKEEADNFSWGRMSQGLIRKYASKIGGLFDEVKTDAFQTYKIPGLSQEEQSSRKVT